MFTEHFNNNLRKTSCGLRQTLKQMVLIVRYTGLIYWRPLLISVLATCFPRHSWKLRSSSTNTKTPILSLKEAKID
jgi:hypothetical protein